VTAPLRLARATAWHLRRHAGVLTLPALMLGMAAAADTGADSAPPAKRQQQLVRMVRQDCGSCHGMRLTGGLGPALTAEALAERPLDSVAATIFHGRPGTPMPPWRAMLSEDESRWIAARLLAGFPEDNLKAQR
jgi:cytochrome c55X